MATTTSTDNTAAPPNPVRAVLKRNTALATVAYNRTAGYRKQVRHAVNNEYDLDLSRDQVHDAILEANRLGLLRKYADTDN